jgi:xanthine dehydrogenase accessory factor
MDHMSEAIRELAQAIQNKRPAALATIVEVKGASPAKVGAQLVMLPDGETVGTVGGGKLESEIIKIAEQVLETKTPALHHLALREEGQDSIGTLCGGEVTVFVQAYFPLPRLVIVGGGHIGRPLKVMGEAAGFEVVVVDVAAGKDQVPELEQVTLTDDSYVVLITTDHISDEAALRFSIKSPAPYIGMIGSLAKCKSILEHLRADGIPEGDLDRVYAPIGLDLGGTSPQEIAVAILAEIIACRQKKGIKERIVKTRRIG